MKFIPKFVKRRTKLVLRNMAQTPAYIMARRGHRTDVSLTRRIIFVCKGNVCRSPFAEHLFRSFGPDGKILVKSCGLKVDQSASSPNEAIHAARSFGINLSGHRARRMDLTEMDQIDLIVPMEYHQYRELIQLSPAIKEKVYLMREFIPFPTNMFCNIDDPYGCNQQEYYKCYLLIQAAVFNLYRIIVPGE